MTKAFCSIFFAICLASPSILADQGRLLPCDQVTKARMLSASESDSKLKAVQKTYEKISSLSAKFSQNSYLAAMDMDETSSGQVWFKKPGQIRWHYKNPEVQDFVVSEGSFWFYQPELDQVSIDDFSEVALSDLPVAFLLGLGKLSEDFQVQAACKVKESVMFELVPLVGTDKSKSRSDLESFKLLVGLPEMLPRAAEVKHLGGNITTIRLEEKVFDKTLAHAVFILEWPENTDVIDRRKERS